MTTIVMPPPLAVAWSCRRCGHTGGSAKCTIPVYGWNEEMMRTLLDSLRCKLVKIHQRQGCIATIDDFVIERALERGKPEEKQVVGLI